MSEHSMTASAVRSETRRWQQPVVRALRRFPWSGRALQWIVRLIQPRYSVGVVGVVLDAPRERVLLVEHVFHTTYPWGLPGGWINRGEDPAQTAEREILEETGLRVRAVQPLIVQRGTDWRQHIDMVFLCELAAEGQAVRLSGELVSYRWTPVEALPPLVAFHTQGITAALAAQPVADR